jgi:hypothetical protein
VDEQIRPCGIALAMPGAKAQHLRFIRIINTFYYILKKNASPFFTFFSLFCVFLRSLTL